jgi:arsenite methyltransferase
MAERDFVTKLGRAGFADIQIVERTKFGIDDSTQYPLFTEDLIELMRRTIPPEQHDSVGMSIVIKARLSATDD